MRRSIERLYQKIYENLSAGTDLVLATVVKAEGSTPRKSGSRMLVFREARSEGTVGGGILEFEVESEARKCLDERHSRLMVFKLNEDAAGGLPMHCGGQVKILLEYLSPEQGQLPIYKNAARLEADEAGFVILADLAELEHGFREVKRELINDDCAAEALMKRLGRDMAVAGKAPTILSEERSLLVERMQPREMLLVFGAGHVGGETALLASHAGFRVRVIDDREDILNVPDFKQAGIDTMVLPEYQNVAEKVRPHSRCYALIITRGHLFDQRVLEQLLPLDLFYTGMIGSRKKRQAIYSSMLEKGYTPEELERVYCPVGLEIGAETPAELAVSIVAQLIQVKAERKNGA